jgi:putative FmdB family regulatory protein
MPLYEFHCPDCKELFEELVGLHDAKAPACPKCGGENARRALSLTAPSRPAAQGLSPMPAAQSGCGGSGGFS